MKRKYSTLIVDAKILYFFIDMINLVRNSEKNYKYLKEFY